MTDVPETHYTRSGEVNIAYQVVGDGPLDLVVAPGLVSNVDLAWEAPYAARLFGRLAELGRLILFDKRGVGVSDRVAGAPSLEERMDDVRAVMDAAGSTRAALLGLADGGAMTALFAATYPERVSALVLFDAKPRFVWSSDFPWGPTREVYEQQTSELERTWGRFDAMLQAVRAQGLDWDDETVRERARQARLSASPGAVAQLFRMNADIDVRAVLPAIRVPTLVLYLYDEESARYIAEQIPGAELAAVPKQALHEDAMFEAAPMLEEFLARATASAPAAATEPERVLATVLFTDLVGSTAKAVELGPRWSELLREHNAAVRRELARYSGREVDTAGDGFFASGFDGPARAIRCACAIRDAVTALGLDVRVGVHTGECELVDGKLSGLAVIVGARVAAQAVEGEVLVSGTVKDLVAGSGIEFDPRGIRELKGLGEWPVYAVTESRA